MNTVIKNPIEPNSFYTLKSVAAQLEMDVKSVRFLIKEGNILQVSPVLFYVYFHYFEKRNK